MPMVHKPAFITLLSIATVGAGLATAQDTPPVDIVDPLEMETTEPFDPEKAFVASDVDESGDLDRDEFVAYIVDQASHGDEKARSIVVSGDYETVFTARDTDENEALSRAEMERDDDHDKTMEDDNREKMKDGQ